MNDRDCDNCAHHSEGGCSVWECSFTPKEDDTISRQAAVDAICGECQANRIPCKYFPCGEIKAVQALPSAQPEEVTPHRNYQYLSDYWCECGWHLGKKGDVNYCSNCGKKVKWDG